MTTTFAFEAIGTQWQIDLNDQLTTAQEQDLLSKIHQRIDVFDRHYSRFRTDSLVTQMSQQAGQYALPADAGPMLALYQDVYALTNGLVTPLIGQVLVDAGYDAQYSLVPQAALSRPLSWPDVIDYDGTVLTLQQPALLDFGAAGKGYLIDLIGDMLQAHHVTSFTIDAGGDILHRASDDSGLKIGLENPENTREVIGVIPISNQSICGSAGNRRAWGEFHHIINPQTLRSPRQILATWVVAASTMVADALSTCLFFVPAAKLAPAYDFEYLILRDNYTVEKSAGFAAELFTI